MINPTVGEPLVNLTVALRVVALLLTIASARRRTPLWPAVSVAVLAAMLARV